MPKILNLDSIAPTSEPRELVLGGTTYVIAEASVADFIEAARIGEGIENRSMREQFEFTINLIKRQIPDIDVTKLHALPPEKLTAVAAFVRGMDPEAIMKSLAQDTSDNATATDTQEAAAGNP